MRFAFRLFAAALLAMTAVTAWAAVGRHAPFVPCADIVGQNAGPYQDGYRLVLGVFSVPPANLQQVAPTGHQPWAYWRKAGLVVRTGHFTATVTVPKAWRSRAAISWGNPPHVGIVNSLQVTGCGPLAPKQWNGYAGGFYFRSPSACVPLIFRVGHQSATVRFGIGRRCT